MPEVPQDDLPRRQRSYPRVVKRARHNSCRVKKTGDTGIQHNGPPTIPLANPVLAVNAAILDPRALPLGS